MSYRDFRDDPETSKAISHALGITGRWNGKQLVEVRENPEEISISAHAANLFKTVKSRANELEVVTTDVSNRSQGTVIINKAGEVKVFKQEWDNASGPIGVREQIQMPPDKLQALKAKTEFQATEALNLFKPHYVAD